MQLARFETFCRTVSNDDQVAERITGLAFFRNSSDQWIDHWGEYEIEERTTEICSRVLEQDRNWRSTNSSVAWFPIRELDCVVAAEFPAPPKKQTRDNFQRNLERCLNYSQNKYDATHDPLTGLANRAVYEAFVLEKIQQITENSVGRAQQTPISTEAHCLLLLSIDLDLFKSINDTYGHQYGDVVLRVLAQRLETTRRSFRTRVIVGC